MIKIKIWDGLNAEESEAKEIELSSAREIWDAVRKFAEHDYDDPWDTAEYHVRCNGHLLKFAVTAEQKVTFRVREIP